jgi:hypothetical protein
MELRKMNRRKQKEKEKEGVFALRSLSLSVLVPETGFEPAHRLRHHHLKVACLPISPPGHFGTANI